MPLPYNLTNATNSTNLYGLVKALNTISPVDYIIANSIVYSLLLLLFILIILTTRSISKALIGSGAVACFVGILFLFGDLISFTYILFPLIVFFIGILLVSIDG